MTYEVDGVYATDTVHITRVELTGLAWETYFVEGQCEDNRPIELWTWGPFDINGVAYTPREDIYEFNGYRVFPEKLTYNDSKTEERKRVFVPASIHPAIDDVPVYFKWFDVDDQFDYQFTDMTAPGAPAFTWPEVDQVDNNGTGPDNCNKDQAVLSAATQPTDAEGLAKPYLQVGRFPGDNYRVVAALDQTRLSKVNQQNIEALGSEPVLGVQATPQRLTVWRTLHLEFDGMNGSENGYLSCFAAGEFGFRPNWPHAGETSLDALGYFLWNNSASGRYEGGNLDGGHPDRTIIDNVSGVEGWGPAEWMVVASPAYDDLPFTVWDDDEGVLPFSMAWHLGYIASRFRPAYIEVVALGDGEIPEQGRPVHDEDVPFVENAVDGDPARALAGRQRSQGDAIRPRPPLTGPGRW